MIRRPAAAAGAAAAAVLLVWAATRLFSGRDPAETVVRRGTLEPAVSLIGTLAAERSDSYGATVPGVELKILWLAQEGSLVRAGDRLIEFDPAPFQKDLDTARARTRELAGEADQAKLALDAARLKSVAGVSEKQSSAKESARDHDALVNTTVP